MRVRLAQGRIARARRAQDFVANCSMAYSIAESDPESWPQYILYWEDGVPELVDVDKYVDWDEWGFPDLDQLEGGAL